MLDEFSCLIYRRVFSVPWGFDDSHNNNNNNFEEKNGKWPMRFLMTGFLTYFFKRIEESAKRHRRRGCLG